MWSLLSAASWRRTQSDPDEADVDPASPVRGLESIPPDERVGEEVGVVAPVLVFQELLAHEQHRDAGRGQEQAGRDAAPAARRPRALRLEDRRCAATGARDPSLLNGRRRGFPGAERIASAEYVLAEYNVPRPRQGRPGLLLRARPGRRPARMAPRRPLATTASKPAPSSARRPDHSALIGAQYSAMRIALA